MRGHKAFRVFHADRVISGLPCGQGQPFQNLEGTMWLAKFGRGMLFSVEQVIIGRDEKKKPTWEARDFHVKTVFLLVVQKPK